LIVQPGEPAYNKHFLQLNIVNARPGIIRWCQPVWIAKKRGNKFSAKDKSNTLLCRK